MRELLQTVYSRRELIAELMRRELKAKHAGSALGIVWAYGHLIALMALYMLLFAYVFPARFGSDFGGNGDFSVSVLAGIIQWLALQEALGRSTTIIVNAQNLVKQIVFPVQTLPIAISLAGARPYALAVAIAVIYAAFQGTVSWMLLLLPVIMVLHLLAIVGIAFLFSALGVFTRDIREVIAVFTSFNLFIQPILYNPFALPDILLVIFYANPFSYACWVWQDVLFHGDFTRPLAWILYPPICLGIFALGYTTFRRLQPQFGDAL
jgi:lipopolysaccharide transport system permease protein